MTLRAKAGVCKKFGSVIGEKSSAESKEATSALNAGKNGLEMLKV